MRKKQNKKIRSGGLILLVILICIMFADILAPNNPGQNNLDMRYAPSTAAYPLGTDGYGRCMLSRLIYGTRYSVGLSLLVMTIVIVSAVPISMYSAYKGGVFEKMLLLICDISMALPPTVLVLSIIGVLGQGIENLIFATVFSYWGWYARIIRSYVMVEKSKTYIYLAITGGNGTIRILFKHILPNMIHNLLVLFSLGIGDVLLTISGFSFLGIALPAGTPEWGAMLNEARSLFFQKPIYAIYPGICVFLTVCAFNLIGEAAGDETETEVYEYSE